MSKEQSAPSIGSVELSYNATGNRVRQIVDSPVDHLDTLLPILRNAQVFADQNGATRSMVRAFTSINLLNDLDQARELVEGSQFSIEGVINLAEDRQPYSLVYFGRNHNSRRSRDSIVIEEQELVSRIRGKDRKSVGGTLGAVMFPQNGEAGYRLERLSGDLSDDDKARLVLMYQSSFASYPFDIESEIGNIVASLSSQVYAARSLKTDLLDAVAVTEQVTVQLAHGRPFTMREMGDSAKVPEAKGLNGPLKLMLIAEAAKDGTDLVFCETRAALGAPNAVNHSIGMEYSGFLPKHCAISSEYQDVDETGSDSVEVRRYGNMNIWALHRDEIRSIGEKVNEFTKPLVS